MVVWLVKHLNPKNLTINMLWHKYYKLEMSFKKS